MSLREQLNQFGLMMMQTKKLSILLLLLPLLSVLSGPIGLVTSFIFTFLIPGLICCRFVKLRVHEVLVVVPVVSVMVSTQVVYYLSLIGGYSRETILLAFGLFAVVYLVVNSSKKEKIATNWSKSVDWKLLGVFLFVFLLSVLVLFGSVWYETDVGIVIDGSNRHDTPLHYAIIESLNNGNFPPEMPNYAGVPINYHYFMDFHTAIIEQTYGFLPKLLPMLNALFILIFAVSIYALARPHGKKAAVYSTILAVFGWGFSYYLLFSALMTGQFVSSTGYTWQYNGVFGLPPIFNDLLQQRPLLMGLPAFALVLTLLQGFKDKRRIVLAGLVTGLLFPFHALSFFCCLLAFLVFFVFNIRKFNWYSLGFLPPLIFSLPFLLSVQRLPSSIKWFGFSSFIKGSQFFYIANLGIPFLLFIVSVVYWWRKELSLKGVCICLLFLPSLLSFTPNPWDMYKFFHFAWIPISVLAGSLLTRTRKEFLILLVFFSVLSSFTVVMYNVSTEYVAVTWDEYDAGLWIRANTDFKAVFLTTDNIYSSPTMLGGRVRVISYLNWPWGHGIPVGELWDRLREVNAVFTGSVDALEVVVEKYNVKYIYVGLEEQQKYPGCIERFNTLEGLNIVYNTTVKIYKVQ